MLYCFFILYLMRIWLYHLLRNLIAYLYFLSIFIFYLCFHIIKSTLILFISLSMYTCNVISVSMFPCIPVSLRPVVPVFLYPCVPLSLYSCIHIHYTHHPELTRVRNILFLFFEIKRAFVYNSTIFKLTDLFILYFSFKMYMPTKNI